MQDIGVAKSGLSDIVLFYKLLSVPGANKGLRIVVRPQKHFVGLRADLCQQSQWIFTVIEDTAGADNVEPLNRYF